jgi:hypothetical protein
VNVSEVKSFSTTGANLSQTTNATALSASGTSGDWEFTRSRMTNVTGTAIQASNSTGNWKATRSSITNVNGTAVDANNSAGEWLMAFTDISHSTTGVSATNSTGNWTVGNTRISNVSTTAVSADNAAGNWSLNDGIIENVSSSTAISNESSSGGRILVFSSNQSLCNSLGCISSEPVAGNQRGEIVRKSVRDGATGQEIPNITVTAQKSTQGEQVQIQLQNGNAGPNATLEEQYDLSRVGLDRDTEVNLNVTILGDKPRAVVGNGRDVEWTRQQNDDGTWDINITGRPATIDYNLTANGTSPASFPDGQNATLGAESAMILETRPSRAIRS